MNVSEYVNPIFLERRTRRIFVGSVVRPRAGPFCSYKTIKNLNVQHMILKRESEIRGKLIFESSSIVKFVSNSRMYFRNYFKSQQKDRLEAS